MDAIESKVREIICNITGLPLDMPGNANLYLDLGVASVHALQLLAELEGQFEVSIPDEDFVEAASVSQLASLMRSLTGAPVPEHLRA